MRKVLLGIAGALLASTAMAQALDGSRLVSLFSMDLGTEFRTISLLCGAATGPGGPIGCPNWAPAQGKSYLLHSVSLMVKADGNCSAMAMLRFNAPGGTVEEFKLVSAGVNAHGDVLTGGGQTGGSDSVAMTFPKPIRVGPSDQFGVGRVYGGGELCAVSVSYGVELAR